jgi:serine/threonine protein kinase
MPVLARCIASLSLFLVFFFNYTPRFTLQYRYREPRCKKRCIFGEMRTRVAMFCGSNEAAQLDLIFQLTGYPQGDALRAYETIPTWSNFTPCTSYQNAFVAKYGTAAPGKSKLLDAVGIDLLQKLLDVNPNTRISAEVALQHDYFRSGVDNNMYVICCPVL